MLGGENPVRASTTSRSRRAQAEVARLAPRPEPLAGVTDPEPDWIIAKATAPQAEDRYASVASLAADVGRYLQGRPIEAGPGSWRYRLNRHARRNKPLTIAASAAALAVIAGTLATGLFAVRAFAAEADAVEQRDVARVERDRAEAASLEALEKARAAEATSRFLQRILFSARPGSERPEEQAAFIRSVERAQRGLATDLLEFPEVRSELLDIIGMIYLEMDRPAEAEPLLLEGWQLRAKLFGEDDIRTLRTRSIYTSSLEAQGRRDEALELIEEGLELAEPLGLPLTLDPMPMLRTRLARLLSFRNAEGDLARLRDLARQSEALLDSPEIPPGSPLGTAEATILSHTADLMLYLSDPELAREGIRLSERAAAFWAGRPEHDPLAIRARSNHIKNYERVGQFDRSIELHEELLPIAREVLGPDHSVTMVVQSRLLQMLGRYRGREAGPEQLGRWADEAVELVERAKRGPTLYGFTSALPLLAMTGRAREAMELAEYGANLPPGVQHVHPSMVGYARMMVRRLPQDFPELTTTSPTPTTPTTNPISRPSTVPAEP
jgi:tetratricopeptide (TPR) repeat protein